MDIIQAYIHPLLFAFAIATPLNIVTKGGIWSTGQLLDAYEARPHDPIDRSYVLPEGFRSILKRRHARACADNT